MNYFKFPIPTNANGSRVTYSPGWHGTMSRCPAGVKVLLYNDKVGEGIAQTEDSFMPKEVTKITEEEALAMVTEAKDEDRVFFGEKLANRWLPEAETEDILDTPETLATEAAPPRIAVDRLLKTCPICHKNVAYIVKYDDKSVKVIQNGKVIIQGLIAKEIILSCTDGHKVRTVLNG